MAIEAGNQAATRPRLGADAAHAAKDMAVTDMATTDTDDARSQFERIRDYLTGQFGAVRQVEEGQQSAELLLDLAEGELGELKRDFAAARLGTAKR